jgi:chorismate dehydratase
MLLMVRNSIRTEMDRIIKVSAVSYLNTAPFVYGLRNSEVIKHLQLTLDHPAECIRKVLVEESDLGLVPIHAILNRTDFNVISDFCIGATYKVRTVALFGHSPLNEIKTIYLDYQSRTSSALVKVLARELWKQDFEWKPFLPSNSFRDIQPDEGMLAIGDKVFNLENHFTYGVDLAQEWHRLTGLPMVFALWATRKNLGKRFVERFNAALSLGLKNIEAAVEMFGQTIIPNAEAADYLRNNISYGFDAQKKEAMKLFRNYTKDIEA